jgi:hypothetical protein
VALAELANSHTHSEDQQMTVALISTKPYAVIATYPAATDTNPLRKTSCFNP